MGNRDCSELQPLPEYAFECVTKFAPLVSIDLIIRDRMGRMWLGKRLNAPAKDFWFVPGGRIRKGERIEVAFARIVNEELREDIEFSDAEFLGNFDHLYEENRFGAEPFSTQYVVLAYQIQWQEDHNPDSRSQHAESKWVSEAEFNTLNVHRNTIAYVGRGTMSSEEQYKIIAARRTATNTMLWQTPALIFTGEAFMLNVATSSTASSSLKFILSTVGGFSAFAALQLLVKHRVLERIDSDMLEHYERKNLHRGFAIAHRARTEEELIAVEKQNCTIPDPWNELKLLSSYDVWRIVMAFTLLVFAWLALLNLYDLVTNECSNLL